MLSNLTAIQSNFYPVSKTSNFQHQKKVAIIPMNFPWKGGSSMIIYIAQIISRWLFIRGHSRKQPNDGHKRNSPQCSTTTGFFFWPYFSVYAQKKSRSLFKGLYLMYLLLGICAKLRAIHRVRVGLNSRLDHVFVRNLFCSDQRVVSWPPQPIARIMTPQESQPDAENFIGWNYHCIERLLDSNQIG